MMLVFNKPTVPIKGTHIIYHRGRYSLSVATAVALKEIKAHSNEKGSGLNLQLAPLTSYGIYSSSKHSNRVATNFGIFFHCFFGRCHEQVSI